MSPSSAGVPPAETPTGVSPARKTLSLWIPIKALSSMGTSQRAGGTPTPQRTAIATDEVLQDFTPPDPISLAELLRCQGAVPHLYRENGSYFVTFRLWDAVEPRGVGVPPAFRRGRGLPPANNRFPGSKLSGRAGGTPAPRKKPIDKMTAVEIGALSEPPLRLGSCILAVPSRRPSCRIPCGSLTASAIRWPPGALCPITSTPFSRPWDAHDPSDILHSWKSYTSHEINKMLGMTGSRWEQESFDHLIRSLGHFEAFVRYVEQNPVAAGLCKLPEDWPYSSAYRGAGVPPAETPTGVPPAANCAIGPILPGRHFL